VVSALHHAFALALVFFTVAAAGCHRDRCTPICEQRAKELGCHPEESCKVMCEKLHSAKSCAKELKLFEDCFVAEAPEHWVCDSDGLPVAKLEFCAKERNAVAACLEKSPPPPHP
jgi:hypothetical protein